MSAVQYLVMRRSAQWWFLADGARLGPFPNQSEAQKAAITAARSKERTGDKARVSLDDPDDGVPVIYESQPN